MSNYKDLGKKSDESTSGVNASFSCETSGKTLILPKYSKNTLTNKFYNGTNERIKAKRKVLLALKNSKK